MESQLGLFGNRGLLLDDLRARYGKVASIELGMVGQLTV